MPEPTDRFTEISEATGLSRQTVKDVLRPYYYGTSMIDIMDFTKDHRITHKDDPKKFSPEFVAAMMASGFEPDGGCMVPDWCPPLHKEDFDEC